MKTTQTFIGNLTKDFTFRTAKSGRGWATGSLAVNKFVKDGEDKVTYIDLKVFSPESAEKFAENVTETCVKGTRVVVTGSLETEKWQGNDGTERTSIVLIVDAIGPDLRWASAEVNRNPRDGESAGRYTPAAAAPAAAAPVVDDPFLVDGSEGEESPF